MKTAQTGQDTMTDRHSHGTKRRYEDGCRCDPCRGVKRREGQRARARKKQRLMAGNAGVPHGTHSGYSQWGCRCDPCKDANSAYQNPWRQRRRSKMLATATNHGKQWTGAELEIVITRKELPAIQLAKILGRTIGAVEHARFKATHDPKWIQVAGISRDVKP